MYFDFYFSYRKGMITYGNGGHFVSNINVTGRWYSSDGLRGNHRQGTGLIKININCDTPPPGYTRDYVVY